MFPSGSLPGPSCGWLELVSFVYNKPVIGTCCSPQFHESFQRITEHEGVVEIPESVVRIRSEGDPGTWNRQLSLRFGQACG
jgi:hypothetical protein